MNLNKYYNESWYDVTTQKLIGLGLNKKGKVIFDVGAGNSVLKDRINNWGSKWIGFDYIPREDYIKKWNVEEEVINIQETPDCILFLEVIEHLFNPGHAIKNICNIAKKDTYIIISTPNPYWSVIRIKFFLLGIFPNFTKENMDNNHHVFTAWPHVMEKLLSDNGFKIIDSYTLLSKAKFPIFTLNPIFLVKLTFYLARKTFELFDKKTKGMSYGVIAKKDSDI